MVTLKACRVNRVLSREEAAKLIGVSKPTLINYETGKTSPNMAKAEKLAEVYQVNISDIDFKRA